MVPKKEQGLASNRGTVEEKIFESLLRTTEQLSWGQTELLRLAELTPSQYNVLRILRGALPEGLSCTAISERMISRDSDMTRLLDRLQERKLVARCRNTGDRRVITIYLTDDGVKLLRGLDGPIERLHRDQFGHLTREQLDTLADLLARARKTTG